MQLLKEKEKSGTFSTEQHLYKTGEVNTKQNIGFGATLKFNETHSNQMKKVHYTPFVWKQLERRSIYNLMTICLVKKFFLD